MRHTYLTTVAWKRVLQQYTDYFVDLYAYLFITRDTCGVVLPSVPKFLFISFGHLGDALILSYIFPLVKKFYPAATIDVLTTSSGVLVLRNNPYVRTLYIYDHIRINRENIAWWKKIYRHSVDSKQVLKKIRKEHYDISVEGRVHYPNGNIFALRARIQHRIGFGSGGYGGLLTTEVKLPVSSPFHLVQAIVQELKVVGIYECLENIQPYYPFLQSQYTDKRLPSPYILIHPESGAEKKMITQKFFLDVMRLVLDTSRFHIVLCGILPETEKLIGQLYVAIPSAKQRMTNLIGKTSLDEFYNYAVHAAAAITIDSFAAHFCAIECPTFSFFKNGSGALYFPLTRRRTVVVHNDTASQNLSLCSNIESHYVQCVESDEALQLLAAFLSDYKNTGRVHEA